MVEQFSIPNQSTSPRLAKFILMLKDIRSRLFEQIESLSQEALDYSPHIHKIETIGTLLLHIAGVEWSWIFEDIDKKDMDMDKWKYAFALRNNFNPPQLTGKPLNFYTDILNEVRDDVLKRLNDLQDSELDKLIVSGSDKYSIEWILYHLIQHESHHIGQINFLKRSFSLLK
ncbi:MAG: DinB family protein [Candidatus Thorarchaeota archaeon]